MSLGYTHYLAEETKGKKDSLRVMVLASTSWWAKHGEKSMWGRFLMWCGQEAEKTGRREAEGKKAVRTGNIHTFQGLPLVPDFHQQVIPPKSVVLNLPNAATL